MIIESSIALFIIVVTLFVFLKTKDRKETLVIKKENDMVYLLLGGRRAL
jgi:hypothetical protein